jgi:hypothetical protein
MHEDTIARPERRAEGSRTRPSNLPGTSDRQSQPAARYLAVILIVVFALDSAESANQVRAILTLTVGASAGGSGAGRGRGLVCILRLPAHAAPTRASAMARPTVTAGAGRGAGRAGSCVRERSATASHSADVQLFMIVTSVRDRCVSGICHGARVLVMRSSPDGQWR